MGKSETVIPRSRIGGQMVGGRVVGDICGHDNEHVILYTLIAAKGSK